MSALWFCPSIISSAYHDITHLLMCLVGWFWRDCCGVRRAQTMLDYIFNKSSSPVVHILLWVWHCALSLTHPPLFTVCSTPSLPPSFLFFVQTLLQWCLRLADVLGLTLVLQSLMQAGACVQLNTSNLLSKRLDFYSLSFVDSKAKK